MTKKTTIQIRCVYYKPSGKWYANGAEVFSRTVSFDGCIYPRDYGEALSVAKRLPGLASGTWDYGYYTISVDGGYTELVKPRRTEQEEPTFAKTQES